MQSFSKRTVFIEVNGGGGGGVLPDVVRFQPRNGKTVMFLCVEPVSRKNNGKRGEGSFGYSLSLL